MGRSLYHEGLKPCFDDLRIVVRTVAHRGVGAGELRSAFEVVVAAVGEVLVAKGGGDTAPQALQRVGGWSDKSGRPVVAVMAGSLGVCLASACNGGGGYQCLQVERGDGPHSALQVPPATLFDPPFVAKSDDRGTSSAGAVAQSADVLAASGARGVCGRRHWVARCGPCREMRRCRRFKWRC